TGGFFDGETFVNSFANCDAPLGLSMGSVAALLITIVFYLSRKVLSFKNCMDAFPEGFKAMISPILILSFAWTLSGLTGMLGAAEYVSGIFEGSAAGLTGMLPAIVFLVAIFLAFSTGTSWGTFGILLPIVVGINLPGNLLIITIAACLAGAVCGDHCSPISDTTIMASAGAQCDHINHVSTQLPYAMLVAAVSFVGYCIAGFVQNAWAVLIISFVLLCAVLFGIKKFFITE
ncbi:MAG: Na+/H+ antiporter NhaC family protein, partial [Lachnospiraceae bacterium]|nr:Na+/H+ antiporter NhaC family protein [Lachnospiraceae bacterium]